MLHLLLLSAPLCLSSILFSIFQVATAPRQYILFARVLIPKLHMDGLVISFFAFVNFKN